METWEILLIVLGIINAIVLISAIWESHKTWKRQRKIDRRTLLIGIFIIPIFVVIGLTWPYILYKFKKEKKEEKALQEKERIEAERRRKITSKYHFQRFGFRLKGLPFKPDAQEIIYVENEYNEHINQIICRNLDYIHKCLDNSYYYSSRFVYLPQLVDELSREHEAINYLVPYLKDENLSKIKNLSSNFLLDYLAVPENRSKIPICFARYRGEQSGYSIYECVGFNPEQGIDEKDFIRTLCSTFDHFPKPTDIMFHTVPSKEKFDVDSDFEKTSKILIKEVQERISQLRKLGVSQWVLEQLIKPELRLSHLVVTKDYRILLPDYNDMEIKMEPLVKAVYLLFLKHPEGILFKHLPDYREELIGIYGKLRPLGMSERAIQSIEDVTNPLLNSINEKCARIRGAFLSQFDDRMARHYYIDGPRGEAKKISLPRDLVIWE